MSRLPRKHVFDPHEVGIDHCINRCVRRAFLCGFDAVTQVSYEHRRQWLQDRLMFLAGVMGLDVLGFCVMSNHFHLIVRNRPDLVDQWTAEELTRRWYRLCPPLVPETGELAAEPSVADIALIVNNPDRLAEIRRRLSSPSWLMRFLTERLARVANREDRVSGRFWEGRFKMQRLLDEWAVAACMVYVDLNPVRAGLADSPETSQYTSIFERLRGVVEACLQADAGKPADANFQPEASAAVGPAQTRLESIESEQSATSNRPDIVLNLQHDLSPQPKGGPSADADPDRCSVNESVVSDSVVDSSVLDSSVVGEPAGGPAPPLAASWLAPLEIPSSAATDPVPTGRLSNLGCLNMTFEEYLQLLDWTGRQWRADKPGKIADHLAPIVQRLGLDGDGWLALVGTFRGRLRRAAGRPAALETEAARRGRRWIQGVGASRAVFGNDRQVTAAGKS